MTVGGGVRGSSRGKDANVLSGITPRQKPKRFMYVRMYSI